MKRQSYKRWTTDEEKRLVKLREDGKSIRECAEILNRTKCSVNRKIMLGFDPATGRTAWFRSLAGRQSHPLIKRLYAIAREQGYNGELLAKKSGLAAGTISNIMAKNIDPKFRNVEVLANTLGFDLWIRRRKEDAGEIET